MSFADDCRLVMDAYPSLAERNAEQCSQINERFEHACCTLGITPEQGAAALVQQLEEAEF